MKNNITNKIYEITIGDFYEHLSRMSDVRKEDETIEFPFKEYTQDNNRRIQNTTSKQPTSVRIFDEPIFGKIQGRKESSISTWREVFTILQKICGYNRYGNTQKSSKYQKEKWKLNNHSGILDEESEWGRDSCKTASIRQTDYVFAGNMHREIWGRDWERDLVGSTEKMVEEFQKAKLFQNIPNIIQGYNGTLSFRDGIFCHMGEGRYDQLSEQRISSDAFEWENYTSRFHRYKQEKNNRIRWRILAPHASVESNERTCQRSFLDGGWLSSLENKRDKFQSKQKTSTGRMPDLSNNVERKFINSFGVKNWEVLSDTGWVPITHIHKTIKYKEWIIKTKSGKSLICADDHIVFDSNYNQVFTKNLIPNHSKILTEDGVDLVVDVIETTNSSNMYDLTVASNDHRLYTDGILSHNTSTLVGYFLWYVLFNEEKTVALLAHKAATAREILDRIKRSYESLPMWMQQGVVVWNKGNIELENKCQIIATSTTSSAIRGFSINCVTDDTKVCIEYSDAYYYTEISNILNKSKLTEVCSREQSDMKYTVYQITNTKNGKIYVGFHKTNNINDGYMGSGKLIKLAIEKYGISAFDKKILGVFDCKEEAEKYEASIVTKEFTLREDTYNIAIGGNVRIMYGENNPFYGKQHTDTTKKMISEVQSTRQHIGDGIMLEGKSYLSMVDAIRATGLTKNQIISLAGNPDKDVYFCNEMKQKMAEEKFSNILDQRRNQKIISKQRFLGVPKSEDHKKKISTSLSGKKKTKEHIDKINKNPTKIEKTAEKHRGMRRSEESRNKMSAAAKGRQASNKGFVYCYNAETKEKMMCKPEDVPDGWVRGFAPK